MGSVFFVLFPQHFHWFNKLKKNDHRVKKVFEKYTLQTKTKNDIIFNIQYNIQSTYVRAKKCYGKSLMIVKQYLSKIIWT